MGFVVRTGHIGYDVVEERGVTDRVVETHVLEADAIARVRHLNAVRAQEAMGTVGVFRGAPAQAKGCTCAGGMRVEAAACPVHDV